MSRTMSLEEFRALTGGTLPGKRRKGLTKSEYAAKFAVVPAAPVLADSERQSQRSLFERHDACQVAIRLPLPPTTNTYWRSWVRPGTTRALTHVGNEGQAYREAVVARWRAHWNGWTPEPMRARLRLLMLVCGPTAMPYDLDNRVKSLQDALVAAGVYADDSQIDSLRVERGPISREGGFVDVVIETIS